MSDFHFLRPYWLLALFPLALSSLRLFRLGREGGDWRRLCDPQLLPYILVHDAGGKTARRASWLFTLGGLLAIAALAGPVWERLPAPAFRNEAALVIALDLSRAMDAADIKPSRLDRARFKIADILKERKDGLTALLVYSGDAFTVTPLTDDAGTINSQLSALSSDLMPTQGSRAELALELAGRLLRQAGLTRGDVLLITNGINLDKASVAANKLASQGYRVSVLGTGAEEGAPTPLPAGGFLQDSKGNIVITKLAAPALRQLAEENGGLYRKLATDNSDLSTLLAFFGNKASSGPKGPTENGVIIEQWRERGPWLLLLLLPISALAFRRGCLLALCLLALPFPERAHALEWQELWQTRDQRAYEAFHAKEYDKAEKLFENPEWKAVAKYKAMEPEFAKIQEEEAAAKSKPHRHDSNGNPENSSDNDADGQPSADFHYNKGNFLAKQKQYPEAIASYDKALKIKPGHEDALYNKQLVEKALKEQQQEKQQSEKHRGQDKQDKQDKGQGKQEQHDQGENKEGQKPNQEQDQNQSGRHENQGNNDNQGEQSQGERQQQTQANEQQQDDKEQGAQEAASRQDGQLESEKKPLAGELERKSEDQQANEQWLRRIPDDPGGLLKRKFEYQYKQRQGRREIAQ